MTDPSSQRVDLDDSRVLSVDRGPGFLLVRLEQRRGTTIRRLAARVADPYHEEAAYCVGEGIMAPHPDPSLPLDFVEYATAGPRHLELQGYLGSESWFTWRIEGSAIEITGLAPCGSSPGTSSRSTPIRGTGP
jgi:hypothetical protein